MRIKILESNFIFQPSNEANWWQSHAMAPSAIKLTQDLIRIYMGCWDEFGISRIGYVDVDSSNPTRIIKKSAKPVLEIGRDGSFDENGVFPGHVSEVGGKIHLYYTGFQLGYKIRHYNFGGLAISDDGENFQRVSEAPILDRADEGLFVRAGQSAIFDGGNYKTVYSAGGQWENVGGKERPVYDVFFQESLDGINYEKVGKLIIKHDQEKEHGLGRPQIIKYLDSYVVFYTRRTLDMKYSFGASYSKDLKNWINLDEQIDLSAFRLGFNSEMIYFPSVVNVRDNIFYLFYSGNGFGKDGLGYLLFEICS